MTPTVENHGGRFMARSSSMEVILGDWAPTRLAILEFDSRDQVHTWLNSPEYTALADLRERSSSINIVVIDG